MAGTKTETGRSRGEGPTQGSAVVDVYYKFSNPNSGWIVEKIAPIPPESRFVVDGQELTHLIMGEVLGISSNMTSAVDQRTADEILATKRE